MSEEVLAGPEGKNIEKLFASIAGTYDLANDVITFGIARRWRRQLVRWAMQSTPNAKKILDCATGTGDLAFDFRRMIKDSDVIGSDFCEPMLAVARRKTKPRDFAHIQFDFADATKLPYPDNEFDICSIAYGIRNVSNVVTALNEMARVTRPGGSVMILETGVIENPVLRGPVRLYFERIVPRLGGLVSGRRAAYEYLQQSSGRFPSGESFCDLAMSTGHFASVEYRPLLGGASYVYCAVVK